MWCNTLNHFTVEGLEDFIQMACQNSQLHGSFTQLHGYEYKLICMEVDLPKYVHACKCQKSPSPYTF